MSSGTEAYLFFLCWYTLQMALQMNVVDRMETCSELLLMSGLLSWVLVEVKGGRRGRKVDKTGGKCRNSLGVY